MNDAPLRTSLLDILQTLEAASIHILLGGGYGLYLKQLHMTQSNLRTLIDASMWPAPRATQDLDLMLSAEIVADANSMRVIRATLDQLHYVVITGAEYMQFERAIDGRQIIKIDLLTAQLDELKNTPAIQADDRRARPTASDRPKLHAHPADGALQLTTNPLIIDVEGTLSNGTPVIKQIAIPHPFPYLLMKLTAYRDRRHDADKDFGRHHALDIFRITAMLTEPERAQVLQNIRQFTENPQVQSCKLLIQSDFTTPASVGVLAMREHPLWQNNDNLSVFLETLQDFFT